jgi:hypothetical protein
MHFLFVTAVLKYFNCPMFKDVPLKRVGEEKAVKAHRGLRDRGSHIF